MKKRIISIINLILFSLLALVNIYFIHKEGVIGDNIILFTLALICFMLYFFGSIFPDKTIKIIHNFSKKIYKNSYTIEVPVFSEARNIFLKRLLYFLICCNLLLTLSVFVYLF